MLATSRVSDGRMHCRAVKMTVLYDLNDVAVSEYCSSTATVSRCIISKLICMFSFLQFLSEIFDFAFVLWFVVQPSYCERILFCQISIKLCNCFIVDKRKTLYDAYTSSVYCQMNSSKTVEFTCSPDDRTIVQRYNDNIY